MPIDRERLLSLWNLEELPACDEGMDLAKTLLVRAFTAVDRLDEADPISLRFAFIAAHKDLVRHRNTCEKCNEAEGDCSEANCTG